VGCPDQTVMISEKRSQAARINGARSRGPVTPEGKARSSRNAIRHGLLAKTVVLSNEDPDVFEDLYYSLIDSFDPVNEAETSMVEDLAASCWRARRALAMEKSILEDGIAARPEKSPIEQITGAFRDPRNKEDLALLHRYEARLHNLYQRTVRGIAALRKLVTANVALPNEPENPLVCNTELSAQLEQAPPAEAADSPAPLELAPLEEVNEDSKNSGRSHAPQCALAADGGRCLNHREQQTNHYEDCETCGDDHRALPPCTSHQAIEGPLPFPVRRLMP
jgi:hypothetical protein